jgi:hypothetical protein
VTSAALLGGHIGARSLEKDGVLKHLTPIWRWGREWREMKKRAGIKASATRFARRKSAGLMTGHYISDEERLGVETEGRQSI